MRKILLVLFLVSVMLVASIGIASAESILFPYVAKGTTVDTLVTVINTTTSAQNTHLYYQYWTKSAGTAGTVAENTAACARYSFYRPTTQNDIVTFSVSGLSVTGSGNAMFGDTTNYTVSGDSTFHTIQTGDRFGYLLVITSNADTLAGVGSSPSALNAIDGEAVLYDIANGAMWGYRALPSNTNAAAAATTASLVFATTFDGGAYGNIVAANSNGVTRAILTDGTTGTSRPRIDIYPPNQFTGRLFVTPVYPVGDDLTNTMQNIANRTVNVALTREDGANGMYDRNEAPRDAGNTRNVICAARLSVADLVDPLLSSASPYYTTGGWAYVDVDGLGTVGAATGVASVLDLKFGAITGQSGTINDGKPVLDHFNR